VEKNILRQVKRSHAANVTDPMQHSSFRRTALTLPVVFLVWLLKSVFADEEPPVDPAVGFYPLISIEGKGKRTVKYSGTFEFTPYMYDDVINLTEIRKDKKPGKLVLLSDGTVTGDWEHHIDIPEENTGVHFAFEGDFKTEVTGTWTSNGSGNVTLTLDATVDLDCKVTGVFDYSYEETVESHFTDATASVVIEAKLTAEGGLDVPIDPVATSFKAILDSGDNGGDTRLRAVDLLGYFAIATGRYESTGDPVSNTSVDDFQDWKWSAASTEGTLFKFGPTEGNLKPIYKQ
jgi:hypothetical protein